MMRETDNIWHDAALAGLVDSPSAR